MKRDLRVWLIPSFALLWLLPAAASSEELSGSARRMLEDVRILASDEFEGRGIGTEGLDKAAEYVSEAFRKAGLDVATVNGGPFQEFEIIDGAELGSPNSLILNGPGGKQVELELDEEFTVSAFGGSGEFHAAPVVFVGYGIEADDVDYNDFEDVDVSGRVLLMMRRNPFQADHHGPFAVGHGISRHAALTTKVSRAFSRGAAAVLFVNDPFTARNELRELEGQVAKAQEQVVEISGKIAAPDARPETFLDELRQSLEHLEQVKEQVAGYDADPLMEFGYGGTRSGKSLPCFHITRKAADQMLLTALEMSLAEIEAGIDKTGQPLSRPLDGWTATGETRVNVVRVPVKNVIGVLEGDGPLKDETIVIGAHYDHLGYGGEGSLDPHSKEIHNGADDNASGTAGLIELARRLSAREKPLPRRIAFIAFTAEERGLLGSEEYVKNPVWPLEETIAMFNMDMIGRMEENKLTMFGTGTSSRWERLVDELAGTFDLEMSKKPEGFGPSDHASFYAKQIPVLHPFTGTHGDYHRPGDEWEKINPRGMVRVIDLLEELIRLTAENPERPEYLHVPGRAQLARSGSRAYFGSIPDFGSEAEGYSIQGVAPGSPAEKAGIQGGDVIVRLGENRIGGLDDFDLALRKFSAGEQVEVVVLREGKEVSLKITLGTPRG